MQKIIVWLALGACVAVWAGPALAQVADPGDPYESTNRKIFEFDRMLDRTFLLPTAKNYNAIVPEFGRDRIHDLLTNLDLPIIFANDVLQGSPKRAGETLARFTVNATAGIGGLFDPATHFNIPNHTEDFGQTLGVWGLDSGPYLVLPGLGPSSPRDITGMAVDVGLDPLTWIRFKQHIWWSAGREYMKVLDTRARNIDTLADIERQSVDFYASTRSLYRQYRASEIRNGQPDAKDLPDL